MKKGKLILFPVPIGADEIGASLPALNQELLSTCRTFIVEELRTARRFLKHAGYPHPIDDTVFLELNEHTMRQVESGKRKVDSGECVVDSSRGQVLPTTNYPLPTELSTYLDAIDRGENIGLLSEAGLPCVADPGAIIARMAQQRGIEVVPLVGPSSLMLALMASGLNGQSFAFNGYLPVDRNQRAAAIRRLEERALREHQTQLFIEAPYRNNQMLETLCATLKPHTMVCVACDLTLPTQYIRTLKSAMWKKEREKTDLHKRNTVFLIGR